MYDDDDDDDDDNVRTLLVGNGGIEDRGTEAFNCRCTAMKRLLSNSL